MGSSPCEKGSDRQLTAIELRHLVPVSPLFCNKCLNLYVISKMNLGTHMRLDTSSNRKRTLPSNSQDEPRLRKCRKGTLSCWACKKRKVRCNYTKADPTCDGCRIRNIQCISQDFPDEPNKINSSSPISDRLVRVEALLGRIIQRVGLADETDITTTSGDNSDAVGELPTPRFTPADTQPSNHESPMRCLSEHHEVCLRLLAAWPDQQSLEALLEVSGDVLGVCHGTICAPIAKVRYKSADILADIARLPSVDSHPVLIAKKLLKLATYLQCLSSKRKQKLESWRIDYMTIMSIAFEASRRNVTSNEDLIGSVESCECLMLEAMYQINSGNLRSAWHSTRRAMIVAQMMGLHRAKTTRSLTALEPDTWTRFDPKYMWFRLMQSNRYLSLMLGMLQGTPNNSFADSQVLDACSPLERMQRIDCVVGGHILQRNEAFLYDTSTTHMIDQQLQKSAAYLPSSWWMAPDLNTDADDEMKTLEDLIRMMDQLTHFHLVTQLHLPHLLQSYTDHEYDYSKIVAMNASREVLIRYTSQSDVHTFSSWCRGISLLALISCLAMCIVHIGAKRQRLDATQIHGSVLDVLAGQHQADRNTMEITLSCMQYTAREGKDPIATKAALILEELLSMEANDVACESEDFDALSGVDGYEFGCDSRVSECGRILRIHVASFGILRFERTAPSGSVAVTNDPLSIS